MPGQEKGIEVSDNETGNKCESWGTTEKESRDNAWKDLREKQGG